MSETRFTTREEIESHQIERLRALVGAIESDNPFWSPRLRAAGVDASISSLAEFRRRMPLLTKAELSTDQDAHPPYGTNLTFPRDRYTRLHQTSSTSGRPLRWLDTPEDWRWLKGGWEAVFDAAEVTGRDGALFPCSFGPFIGFWMAWDAAIDRGCLCIPGGGMNTSTRLRALVANDVSVVCCTPTYAIRLGEAAAEEGLDLSKAAVRTIIVAGEPGGSVPAVRARIGQLWPGARVFDHHGMTEVGPVTFECPLTPGVLHVNEDMYLCEVVDEGGAASDADRTAAEGELVLTTLGRFGSPVLRYRTGDLVRPEAPGKCACGRVTLRLRGGIIGRRDDMVVIRGTNLYPSALDAIMGTFREVAEYRAEIGRSRGMADLRVIIEPRPGVEDATALCGRVEQAIRNAWNLRVPVRPAGSGELPRFDLKARRWVFLDE